MENELKKVSGLMLKKVLCIFLTMIMVLSSFGGTINVFAEGSTKEIVASGQCGADGDNVIWTVYNNKELVISGNGAISDYSYDFENDEWEIKPGWCDYSYWNVIVEEGITEIGNFAFFEKDISSISIADTVERIGVYSISCIEDAMDEIVLPENLKRLEDNALFGIWCLEKIHIPKDVEYIGDNAFGGCYYLEEITIDENNSHFKVIDNVLFDFSTTKLIQYPSHQKNTTYVVPEGVTELAVGCFSYADVENIYLSDSTEVIKTNAFFQCETKNLFVPVGLKIIEEDAFVWNEIEDIYYEGTQEQWNNIDIRASLYANIHFNSGDTPTRTDTDAPIRTDTDAPVRTDTDATEEIYTISAAETKTIKIEANKITYLKFVPEVSGTYSFESNSNDDTYGYLYDENMNQLAYNDDGNNGYNFKITCDLIAGNTYYFGAKYYGSSWPSGSYDITLTLDKVFCEHKNTKIVDAIEMTCHSNGYTEGEYCEDCESYISGHELIPASHIDSDFDQICDICKEEIYAITGTCGGNLIYDDETNDGYYYDGAAKFRLYDDGTLEIYGEGTVDDYFGCNGVFEGSDAIKKVIIRDGITSIGSDAFYLCENLTSVIISETIVSIGSYAFSHCRLSEITLPRSIERIGSNAFNVYGNLKITIINPQCNISDSNNTIPDDAVIYGYKNSTAKAYAEKHDITFIEYCPHENTNFFEETPATCTQSGYTSGEYCNDCEEWLEGHEFINILPHKDENSDNICDACNKNLLCDIFAGERKEIEILANEITYLKFIPEVSGSYTFKSNSINDTFGYLYDEDKNEIASDDNGEYYGNFSITYELEAGVTYYWGARYYNTNKSGSFDVTLVYNGVLCEHKNTTNYESVDATCTQSGYTAGTYCDDCEKWIEGHAEIKEIPHTYKNSDGICDVCGSERGVIGSGKAGQEVYYNLYADGELVISGSGNMYSGFDKVIKDLVAKEIIKLVTIKDGVTTIGEYAFSGCTSLKNVTIPNSVTAIGEYAFYRCKSLISVTIPNGLTTIGDWAFYHCTSLQGITIPDSVTYIGDYAFHFCDNLKDVYYLGTEEQWNKIEIDSSNDELLNAKIHFNSSGNQEEHTYAAITKNPTCTTEGYTTYTCSCGSTYVDDKVPALGHKEVIDKAVEATCTETGLTEGKHCSVCNEVLVAQTTVDALGHTMQKTADAVKPTCTENGKTAVYTCANGCGKTEGGDDLDGLPHTDENSDKICDVCGNSTKEIIASGNWGANGDNVVWSLDDDGELIISGSGDMRDYYEGGSPGWFHADEIKTVIIEEGITSIGDEAFCDCVNISEIIIPESVTKIGKLAFCGTSIEKIIIPQNVTEISTLAFMDCSNLSEITVDENNAFYKSENGVLFNKDKTALLHYPEGKTETSYEIPDGVISIGDRAFVYCDTLETLTIPENVITIDNMAFLGCKKIAEVYYHGTEEQWTNLTKNLSKDNILLKASVHYIDSCFKGHDEINHEAQAPTCTEIGWEDYVTCSRCDYTTYEEIAATGHDYKETVIAPTCTAEGYTTYDCSRCDDTYVDNKVPALCHTEVIDKAVAATCTETGLTEGKHCSVCDEVLVAQTTIDALGHNMLKTADKVEATCTSDGKTAVYTCANDCGKTEGGEVIDKLGHTEGESVIENEMAATCTDKGSYEIVVYCSVCEEELSRVKTVVDAHGHTAGAEATCTTAQICTVCQTELEAKLGHDYKTTVTEPTCTAEGYTTYDCSRCDDTYVDNKVPALGHTEVIDNAVEATCTETGLTEGKHCSVCNEVIVAQTTVAAFGHDMHKTANKVEATCTTNGKTAVYTCANNCGKTEGGEVIEKLGHTEAEAVIENEVAATCTENGSYETVIYCSVCEAELSRVKTVVDAHGHIAGAEATCTTAQICTVCQTELEVKLGHDYKTTVTEPTCTAEGYTTYDCSRCDDTYVDDKVPALGHTEVIDNAVEATCTETGLTEGKHCSVCNEVLVAQTTVDALGHTMQKTADKVEATCTTNGKTAVYTCANNCGKTEGGEVIEKLGHDYKTTVTESTCTAEGYTTYDCSRCDDTYVDDKVSALGHDEVAHEAKAPTCTEIGWDAYVTCSRCDYTTYEEVAQIAHKLTTIKGKAATCTATGLTDGKKCSVCGTVTVEQQTIAKLGHSEVKLSGKAATCSETGLTDGKKCSVCGAVTVAQKTIAKLGHKEVTIAGKSATCTSTGLTDGKKCSVCGVVTVAQKTIAKLGHKEVTVAGKAATCTKTGLTDGKKCSVCGVVTVAQKTISKKAHTYKNVTTKATLSKSGKVENKCSVCGKVSKTTTVYYPKTIKLSKTAYTYNGKAKTPSVIVKDSKGNTLKKNIDYTVKYASGRKNTGKYSVTITFKGKYSGTKTLYFTIAPKTTSKVTATQTTSSITLKWSKVTGATGYRVFQKVNGKWKTLTNTTKLTYTVKKLKVGSNYNFAVRPYTVDGKDTILASTFTQLKTATKCNTPTLKVTSTKKGVASLSWTNVAAETGYELYGSSKKNSDFKSIATTKANVAKASKNKLTSKKTYYFKVRAYKTVNGVKVYSDWSAVKSVKVK